MTRITTSHRLSRLALMAFAVISLAAMCGHGIWA